MYGMVNEGLRTFVEKEHGPDMWREVCEMAGVEAATFERMTSYHDSVTYSLVGAVCQKTGKSADEVLEPFGTYWVTFAGASNFGTFLRLAGNTFVERIKGLDDMHDSILLSMPHLKPPSFEIEEVGPNDYELSYFSEREGLAPMVIGLLYGLAAETNEKIKVTQIVQKKTVSDPDVFKVTLVQ